MIGQHRVAEAVHLLDQQRHQDQLGAHLAAPPALGVTQATNQVGVDQLGNLMEFASVLVLNGGFDKWVKRVDKLRYRGMVDYVGPSVWHMGYHF